jgi:hypothetical protein
MVRSFVQTAVCIVFAAQAAAGLIVPRQTTESFPTVITSKITGPPGGPSGIVSSVIPIISNTGPPLGSSSTLSGGPSTTANSSGIVTIQTSTNLPSSSISLPTHSGSSSRPVPSGPSGPSGPSALAPSPNSNGAIANAGPVGFGFAAVVGAIVAANLF